MSRAYYDLPLPLVASSLCAPTEEAVALAGRGGYTLCGETIVFRQRGK